MTDQFQLAEDQRAIQEMARRFTADAITPFAAQWDEEHLFPRETIKAAAELGFGAIYQRGSGRHRPRAAGSGAGHGSHGLWLPATSAFISIHNMAAWMIDKFGGDAIKARTLPGLVTMDRWPATA
jgi:acyl-CoA dehydrogenase